MVPNFHPIQHKGCILNTLYETFPNLQMVKFYMNISRCPKLFFFYETLFKLNYFLIIFNVKNISFPHIKLLKMTAFVCTRVCSHSIKKYTINVSSKENCQPVINHGSFNADISRINNYRPLNHHDFLRENQVELNLRRLVD